MKRTARLYWLAVATYALLLAWWLVFFSIQGDRIGAAMRAEGVPLTSEQDLVLMNETLRGQRMLLLEGGFLGLVLLGSVLLVLRSARREAQAARQQRHFLSAVTHELRSPIASARLYLESLLGGRAEGEKRERYLTHARQDMDRLAATVDAILKTTSLHADAAPLDNAALDLERLVADARPALDEAVNSAGAALSISGDGPVPMNGDAEAVALIVRNLVSNAAKYGGATPRIEVEASATDGEAVLSVRDFGPGLAAIAGRDPFGAFVRGRDTEAQPGIGLGLHLVAELTTAMGGRVRAADAEGGGALFTCAWPLGEDPA